MTSRHLMLRRWPRLLSLLPLVLLAIVGTAHAQSAP